MGREAGVRPGCVEVIPTRFDSVLRVVEGHKPVYGESFVAKLAADAVDEGVQDGLRDRMNCRTTSSSCAFIS